MTESTENKLGLAKWETSFNLNEGLIMVEAEQIETLEVLKELVFKANDMKCLPLILTDDFTLIERVKKIQKFCTLVLVPKDRIRDLKEMMGDVTRGRTLIRIMLEDIRENFLGHVVYFEELIFVGEEARLKPEIMGANSLMVMVRGREDEAFKSVLGKLEYLNRHVKNASLVVGVAINGACDHQIFVVYR